MPTFSQRMGLKPIRDVIQKDGMDDELKTALWNVLYVYYIYYIQIARVNHLPYGGYSLSDYYQEIKHLYMQMCFHFWVIPIDKAHDLGIDAYKFISVNYEKFTWNQVYDFLEFVQSNFPSNKKENKKHNQDFVSACNNILATYLSAYRFVNGKIVEITSEEEITSIETAVAQAPDTVKTHLQQAVTLLADKQNPDYRNAMKESISAVEAICKQITNMPDATLGRTLQTLESQTAMHPALKDGLQKLYTYTNDDQGIRHALKDAPTVDSEDAVFMLVTCSAFINYLMEKARKAGISL